MNIEELKNNIENFITDLRDDEIKQSSLQVYRTNINQFIKYLKENNKDLFNKTDYINYRDYMKDTRKYEITTINRYIVILNKYFAYLVIINPKIFHII